MNGERPAAAAGTGLISTIAGVTVFLAFLLFAVQLLMNLHATSAVTDAAWDGARHVAGARVDHGDPSRSRTPRPRPRCGCGLSWAASRSGSTSTGRGPTPSSSRCGSAAPLPASDCRACAARSASTSSTARCGCGWRVPMSEPTGPTRLAGDGGQVAGIEALPFGVLIFVVGALLVSNLWAVVDAKIVVDAAAREAVRAYVEAPDATTGAAGRGVAARWSAARASARAALGRRPPRRRPSLRPVRPGDGHHPLPGPRTPPAVGRRPRPRLRRARAPHRADRPLPLRAPGHGAVLSGPGGRGRLRRDRGSVLMLMPAAVLIVLLLGAIAVDLTIVHLRQR